MSAVTLTSSTEGRWRIDGEIDFTTVMRLRQLGDKEIGNASHGQLYVDLSSVTNSNSAGIALMFAWQRKANLLGKKISFENIPPSLLRIAKVCGALELISR